MKIRWGKRDDRRQHDSGAVRSRATAGIEVRRDRSADLCHVCHVEPNAIFPLVSICVRFLAGDPHGLHGHTHAAPSYGRVVGLPYPTAAGGWVADVCLDGGT